jgi:glycosyltransferase involved in cell wall biosynthesis
LAREALAVTDRISVIVATYNRPDALDACLRGLSVQTDRNFEIVVADDGSEPETGALIAAWARKITVPVRHAWHPDDGFRLAEIRNRAIRISVGAYCVFLDGDCIPRPDFVAAHRGLMEKGWFVTGNRVLLSQKLTERVLKEGLEPEHWGFWTWVGQRLRGGVNRLSPLFGLRFAIFRKRHPRQWTGARGSNMAFWRSDLDSVDGFDAAFTGWGREDSDIFVRMIRNGVRRKDGRFATAVLHLWHPEANRSQLPDNERRLAELRSGKRTRAQAGLSHLFEEIERGKSQLGQVQQAS